MSRAAQSKSRAEKKAGQSAPTPAITHEIVPGKFNDGDWNKMVDQDDGEEFIADIMEELMGSTMSIIFKRYIEKQLLPYTLSQAKDAILTMINWQFLAHDEGDPSYAADEGWQEDAEPNSVAPDCWAQGSVPKTFVMSRTASVASLQEDSASLMEEPPEVDDIKAVDSHSDYVEPEASDFRLDEEVFIADETPKVADDPKLLELVLPKKIEPMPTEKRKQKPYKVYTGRMKPAEVKTLDETLEDAEKKRFMADMEAEWKLHELRPVLFDPMPHSVSSILKLQPGRPPGNRDVYYDASGNVISMARLDPDKLPTHRIKTKFTVVDPAVDEAQARLDALRTGRFLPGKKTLKQVQPATTVSGEPKHGRATAKTDTFSIISRVSSEKTRYTGSFANSRPEKGAATPLPPPLLESMEVVPGVTVKEGLRIKKGQQLVPRSAERFSQDDPSKLKPISTNLALALSVKDFLKGKAPMIRMQESPIPPIVPRPPDRMRGVAT